MRPSSYRARSGSAKATTHCPAAIMKNRFAVTHWAAWAPGLSDQAAWLPWPDALPETGTDMPALTEMPAIMRRRLDRLGRMALQVAYQCQGDATLPVIFASRHGDISRSVELLRSLAETGSVSPTQFSLSVHNAIAALYSIARGDTGSYSAVAAGAETVEAAFTEAFGLLADGAPGVMIVCYEDRTSTLPAAYAEANAVPHAWACRLESTDTGGFSLNSRQAATSEETLPLAQPGTLAALRFLITDARRHEHRVGNRIWQWQRHA